MYRASPFLVCIIIVSIALFVPGCSERSEFDARAPVVIGAVYPMSGDLAEKGLDCSRGVTMAVEDINASGGIISLGGAELRVIIADSGGSPDAGQRHTEELIHLHNAVAIVGAYQSSVTRTATQAAERLRTPFIVDSAIADTITERGFRYTFRIGPKSEFYGRIQVQFLLGLDELAGYRVQRVALIHENTDFGTAAALAQKEALKRNGLEMVAEASYQAEGVKDLSAEISQILAAQPDAILEASYLEDGILIRRALREAGSQVPLVDTAGGTVSPAFIKSLGPLADGCFTVVEYLPGIDKGSDLSTRFEERFGEGITGESAHAYQAVWVLKDALERSGSTDGELLRQALAGTDMEPGSQMVLPAEGLRFDSSGQNQYAPLFVAQIQEGKLVPVWPAEYATAPLSLP